MRTGDYHYMARSSHIEAARRPVSNEWHQIEDLILLERNHEEEYRQSLAEDGFLLHSDVNNDEGSVMRGQLEREEYHHWFTLTNWFGLKAAYMPCETARDFCMRERTYMSWSKFLAMVTVLSVTMFLDLRIINLDKHYENIASSLALTSEQSSSLTLSNYDVVQQVISASDSGFFDGQTDLATQFISTRTQDITLGSIYFALGVLSWVISTSDYFKCIHELAREHIFLDECEDQTNPIIALFSVMVCTIVLVTVILLLVQHES